MKTFRYDCKLDDRNCPEYGMCPVYGELTLSTFSAAGLINCFADSSHMDGTGKTQCISSSETFKSSSGIGLT